MPTDSLQKSKILFQDTKGIFSFFWGYNRAFFSPSDIHFKGPDYDFTLFNIKAKDRPAPFSFDTYVNPKWMWVPQYNYRFGYFLTSKWNISLGMDHMKYVMVNNQEALISGTVSQKASLNYQGNYIGDSVLVTPEFLLFEHTNGFNLLDAGANFCQQVFNILGGKINFSLNAGGGVGALIPKTDVRVFGKGLDNRFHLAGYSFSAIAGSRLSFCKRFFISAETKGGYVNLPSVLIHNDSPERANHSLWFWEYYVVGGIYFRIGKKN